MSLKYKSHFGLWILIGWYLSIIYISIECLTKHCQIVTINSALYLCSAVPDYLGVCGISQCQVKQPGRCNEPGWRGPQWWQHPATLTPPSSSSSCWCWWWTRSSARMTPGRTSTWSPCLLGRRVRTEEWGPGWLSSAGVLQDPRRGPPPPCCWRRGRSGSRPSEPPCSSPWSQVRTRGSGHAARDAGLCRSLLHGGARLRADDRGGGVAEQAVGRGGEVSSRALNEGQHEGS